MWSCHDWVVLILSFGSLHLRALGLVHSSVNKFISVSNSAQCTWVLQEATCHGWAWSYNYKQLLMLSTMSHLILVHGSNQQQRLSMTIKFLQAKLLNLGNLSRLSAETLVVGGGKRSPPSTRDNCCKLNCHYLYLCFVFVFLSLCICVFSTFVFVFQEI